MNIKSFLIALCAVLGMSGEFVTEINAQIVIFQEKMSHEMTTDSSVIFTSSLNVDSSAASDENLKIEQTSTSSSFSPLLADEDSGYNQNIDDDTTTDGTTDDDTTTKTTADETSTTDDFTITTEEGMSTSETPVDDCNITSSEYFLTEDNKLTISWNTTNNFIPCFLLVVNITLKQIDCDDNECTQSVRIDDGTTRAYTFQDKLEACASYEYRIYAFENDIGLLSINKTFKAREQVEQLEVQLQELNQTSLIVTWNHTTQFPICSKKFLVEVRLGNNRFQTFDRTDVYNQTVENLEPCENYTITVSPKRDNDVLLEYGDSKNTTMSLLSPGPVKDILIEYLPQERALEVSWKEPEVGRKCVENYKIEANSSAEPREPKFTKNLKSGFSDVFACIWYTIHVTSLSILNSFQESTSRDFLIPARAFLAPSVPTIISIQSRAVSLQTNIDRIAQKNLCMVMRYELRCTDVDSEIEGKSKVETNNTIQLAGLEPFTDYKCDARVENDTPMGEIKTWSPWSVEKLLKTKEGTPSSPVLRLIDDETTSTSCKIEWNPPTNPKDNIIRYEVFIQFQGFTYYNPESCINDFENETEIIRNRDEFPETNYIFNKAYPSAKYYIQVKAYNTLEHSISNMKTCETLAGPSNEVKNFSVQKQSQALDAPYNRTTVISWDLPCRCNGNISRFLIQVKRMDDWQSFLEYNVTYKNQESFENITEELLPDENYDVSIRAFNEEIEGKVLREFVYIEAGLPDMGTLKFEEIYDATTKFAIVTIPREIFSSDFGRITEVWFLVAELNCGNNVTREVGFAEDGNSVKSWLEAKEASCVPQYLTERLTESSILSGNETTFDVTIGSEYCDSTLLCNGPLKPGTEYALTIRAFTSKGYSDTNYITIKTEAEVPLLLISIIVLSVMCIVFFVGFYISYKKTKAYRQQSNDSPNDSKDVPINEFANIYQGMLVSGREKIKEEYKEIQSWSDSLDKTCIASVSNQNLNRYSNISPFDENRVVLNDDEFENDYINASFINGYHYPREYIAAQGPKPNTGLDFWRMVLKHKTESIVMLTSLVEDDKVKCHEYFPKLNGEITFGSIKITCKIEDIHPTFIQRTMEIEKSEVKHTVKHYYFTMWPDHGVPSNTSALIEFCKAVRSERQKADGTIIVHCSAGVGRTGTFIAIDIMLQRMKQERKINIYELVKQLRTQRMKMVQTADQYVFLYTSGLAMVLARAERPQVLQNLFVYLNDFKLFNRLTESSSDKSKKVITSRDRESSF